jgi:hypothetical protein
MRISRSPQKIVHTDCHHASLPTLASMPRRGACAHRRDSLHTDQCTMNSFDLHQARSAMLPVIHITMSACPNLSVSVCLYLSRICPAQSHQNVGSTMFVGNVLADHVPALKDHASIWEDAPFLQGSTRFEPQAEINNIMITGGAGFMWVADRFRPQRLR